MKEMFIKLFKNLIFSIILTTICFILSAILMTYLKAGFDIALYLIQCAIIVPCLIMAYNINNLKYVFANAVMYTMTIISLILLIVNEFTINKNVIFFVLIVMLSSLCGYLFRKYFIDKA